MNLKTGIRKTQMNFVKKNNEFDINLNYDAENLLEFLTAYKMGMDKIIDNVVLTKKAKVHTRKVCQPWYNNLLRDQKNKTDLVKI